ncbi:flagellar basal body P-ring formation chaperone FlgA [Vibrio owensii]|uniref:flagellar basal body P-ring formation chaperone FlgA n=1 Tax=Vibrio owensii TaxID=696485 RepID=UPI0018F10D8B|nr:flagellar basal body P-ring formation chaperone FlgA [Vibrio owensii]
MFKLLPLGLVFVLASDLVFASESEIKDALDTKLSEDLKSIFGKNFVDIVTTFRMPGYAAELSCDYSTLKKVSTGVLGATTWYVDCARGNLKRSVKVRVNASAQVKLPVLATRKVRGEQVGPSDWVYQVKRLSRRGDYLLSVADCSVLLRSVPAGKEVKFSQLGECADMSKDDSVQILFASDSVSVYAEGVLLESGGWGDSVKVRNLASGRVLVGVLERGGVVRLR